MYIGYSCCYVKDGQLNYIIAWDHDGADDAPDNNNLLRNIAENGNIYSTTGNLSTGVPAPLDTNFYSAFGADN